MSMQQTEIPPEVARLRYLTPQEIVYAWCNAYETTGKPFPPQKLVAAKTGLRQSTVSEWRAQWLQEQGILSARDK